MAKSILIIDDEHIFTFIAGKLITGLELDTEIIVAETGEQGLNLIRENFTSTGTLPHLILVDFYMSPMDGVSFVKSFYALDTIPGKEKVHIALTTSSTDSADIDEAKSVGVKTFLAKPISEIKLRELLEQAGFIARKN